MQERLMKELKRYWQEIERRLPRPGTIPPLLKNLRTWIILLTSITILLLAATVSLAQYIQYTVQPGDTLYRIAVQFGTTVQAIVDLNDIENPDVIYVGQVLQIPSDDPPPPPDPTPTPPPGPTPTPPPPPPPGGSFEYTVQPGDTLYGIATQFGVTVQSIIDLNNLLNPDLIYVGQILLIPSDNPPPPPPPPPVSSGFEVGGQTTGLGNASRMHYAGLDWVKIQVKWSPGDDPAGWAGIIQEAHNNGFKILLSVTGATAYPPPGSIDFGAYVGFVGGLASYNPDAIEVWNEQNIDFEWPAGEISPYTYVNELLRPSYNTIKSANGNVMVVSGAPAPTGFDNGTNAWADNRYIAGMAAAGAANYMDCVGVHYNAGATSPYATSGHPGGSHYSWYFGPMLNLYSSNYGGARPLCFTELGYLSAEGFSGLPPGFAWASGTSLAEHAQWLGEAVSISGNDGRVRMLIVFNVDFTYYDPNGDPQAGYAMIRPGGSCPACDTIRAVTGGN